MSFAQPFKDYEILDRVGAGAMGTVFKARHHKLMRMVALKVLRPSLARDLRYVDRLRREARIVAALQHPNIVAGLDLGEEGGYHYFVMEFVDGKSLRALLSEWGMFGEEQVLDVCRQVANALDHAYARGVIHRDIKPGNILIDDRGTVKLTDMGLAKGPTDLTLTRDGATIGTPQYISPEQARSPQDVDVRSDLYSLGATLYHMATGQPPFRGDTMAEVITKVLNDPVVPPRELNPQLSESVDLLLRKLLTKDVRLRYQTPRELLDDLDRIRDSKPLAIDARRLTGGPGGTVRRWRPYAATGAVLVLGLAAAWWAGRPRETPDVHDDGQLFIESIDRQLQQAGSPLARWRLLRATPVRPGFAAQLQQRERVALADLQADLDALLVRLRADQGTGLQVRLHDPRTWPPAADVLRLVLDPALLQALGCAREQLPDGVVLDGLRRFEGEIETAAAQRDRQLAMAFDGHLQTELGPRVDLALRRGQFAVATTTVRAALTAFLDGELRPAGERLAEPLRRQLAAQQLAFQQPLLVRIDQAETAVAAALRQEAANLVAEVRRLAAPDAAPVGDLSQWLVQRENELRRVYPAPAEFRSEHDPWPAVNAELAGARDAGRLAMLQLAARRTDWLLDRVWAAVVDGSPATAGDLLAGAFGTEVAPLVAQHREALAAADAFGVALLAALARAEQPVSAYLRRAPLLPVALRVSTAGALTVDGTPLPGGRTPRLADFLFAPLLAVAQGADATFAASLPAVQARRGALIWAMVGDDHQAVAQRLRQEGDDFLWGDVWPRLQRIRAELNAAVPDRERAWRDLLRLYEQRGEGDDGALAAAASAFLGRFRREDLSAGDRAELERIEAWLLRERKRGELVQALEAQLGASGLTVLQGDDGIDVHATIPAGRLAHARGWRREGDLLIADAAAAPVDRALELRVTLADAGRGGNCVFELVVPPRGPAPRQWLLEFRGVRVLCACLEDDRLVVAVVGGDASRPEALQQALRQALSSGSPSAPLLPGAVHRMSLTLVSGQSRTRAHVQLHCERQLLVEQQVDVDVAAMQMAVRPNCALAVRSFEFGLSGIR